MTLAIPNCYRRKLTKGNFSKWLASRSDNWECNQKSATGNVLAQWLADTILGGNIGDIVAVATCGKFGLMHNGEMIFEQDMPKWATKYDDVLGFRLFIKGTSIATKQDCIEALNSI